MKPSGALICCAFPHMAPVAGFNLEYKARPSLATPLNLIPFVSHSHISLACFFFDTVHKITNASDLIDSCSVVVDGAVAVVKP